MEVKINRKRNLVIRHHLSKNENYKINKTSKFNNISIYKKPQKVNGIASYCEDGKHCLFIDYDNCCKWIVLEDFKRIQEKYHLPPAYLFSTKEEEINKELVGNYHIICLIKLNPKEIYSIISETHSDVNYISMPLRNSYKNWILRISSKGKRNRPQFIEVIGEQVNLDREISKPHLDFLNKIYQLQEIKYKKLDDCKKIFLQEYDTLNT